MEQANMQKQFHHPSGGPIMEGFLPGSPKFILDPSRNRDVSGRLIEANTSDSKPGLNYSIQTGEEFALEFMRDRVQAKKTTTTESSCDASNASSTTLGRSYMGIESAATVPMLPIGETGSKEASFLDQRNHYGLFPSVPQMSSVHENKRRAGGNSSGDTDRYCRKIKVLCSFDGRILPRPSDGKLRYVGGDTHIIRISKDITWEDLKEKTLELFGQPHVVKYQLPGEGLDALVSVSCDEDLQNMMEEWNEIDDREGSLKLRIFLFSMSDLENAHYGLGISEEDSEMQYVASVNWLDMNSRRSSSLNGLRTPSSNNLDELDMFNVESDATGFVRVSVGTTTLPVTTSYQPSIPNFFHATGYEPLPQFYQQPVDNLHYQESATSYPHTSETSSSNIYAGMIQHAVFSGGNIDSIATPSNRILVGEIKHKHNTVTDQQLESQKFPVPGSAVAEGNVNHRVLKGDAHYIPENNLSADHSNFQVPKTNNDDDCSVLSAATGTVVEGSTSPPHRMFSSEKFPREQAELLNRLTKSDDSLGCQMRKSHSRCEKGEPNLLESDTCHSTDAGIPSSPTELPRMSSKLFQADSTAIDNEKQFLKYNQFSGPETQNYTNNNSNSEAAVEPEFKQAGVSEFEKPDAITSGKTLVSNFELPNHVEVQDDPIEINDRGKPVMQVTSGIHHIQPPSNLLEPHWCEMNVEDSISLPESESLITDVTQDLLPSVSKKPDIIIDIDDRFAPDFITEIFSTGLPGYGAPGIRAAPNDGAGVSVNMENHEPKHWSYFQKLAQEDFGRKDVSLMDQDHHGDINFNYTPVLPNGVPVRQQHLQHNPDDGNNRGLSEIMLPESDMLSDFESSHLKETDNMPFDVTISREMQYKDESKNVGLSPFDPVGGNIDLQFIENDDLEELRELGSGTFGTVYHGKWRGSDVAIKRLKKTCFAGRSSEQHRLTLEFWHETEILSKLHHPNVVAFYGVVQDGPEGTLATVTEYMVDGSLRQVLLRKDKYLDRRKKLLIAMDAAFGMEYLHSKNIVHFDLKCDNLLVNLKDSQRPICKVGDFGLSKIKRNTLVSGGVRGTLPWMAPELLNSSSNKVSEKVDVFSFGIVLWEILTEEEPYANMHYGAILGGIVSNTLRPTIPNNCDPDWRRLMEQCWAPNPASRPAFSDVASRLRVMSTAANQSRGHNHKPSK